MSVIVVILSIYNVGIIIDMDTYCQPHRPQSMYSNDLQRDGLHQWTTMTRTTDNDNGLKTN